MTRLPGAASQACRGCGAQVMFVKTVNGKNMPVNAEIDEAGNLAVYRDGNGRFVGRVLTKSDPHPAEFERRMMPHMATCTALAKRPSRPTNRPLPANVIPISKGRELHRRR